MNFRPNLSNHISLGYLSINLVAIVSTVFHNSFYCQLKDTANPNFLKTMKYDLAAMKGKHHKLFVPKEMVNTKEYEKFWADLAEGKPNTGVFKRITSSGETVWLNAIYNPIKNANGKVVKVIKFATVTTRAAENAKTVTA